MKVRVAKFLQATCKASAKYVQTPKSNAKLLQNQILGDSGKHPYLCNVKTKQSFRL
jgi:hypothetical protein